MFGGDRGRGREKRGGGRKEGMRGRERVYLNAVESCVDDPGYVTLAC